MDFTVFMPSISGLIGVLVGAAISSRTQRSTNNERLATDQKLAERKIEADIALAQRKLEADLVLAEKKIELDQNFAAWKRNTDFAEEILSDFYEARDIINGARSPGIFGNEGESREKELWETDDDTRQLNSFYAPAG
jgi:hypothetical protein